MNITEHGFDSRINLLEAGIFDLELEICDKYGASYSLFTINKSDSIAMANHFYSQLETPEEKNAFLDNITSKSKKEKEAKEYGGFTIEVNQKFYDIMKGNDND